MAIKTGQARYHRFMVGTFATESPKGAAQFTGFSQPAGVACGQFDAALRIGVNLMDNLSRKALDASGTSTERPAGAAEDKFRQPILTNPQFPDV